MLSKIQHQHHQSIKQASKQTPTLETYVLVSAVSYSLSLSNSKMSTSTLAFPALSGARLILFLASVMDSRSPLLHSMGSSKMAAAKPDRTFSRSRNGAHPDSKLRHTVSNHITADSSKGKLVIFIAQSKRPF